MRLMYVKTCGGAMPWTPLGLSRATTLNRAAMGCQQLIKHDCRHSMCYLSKRHSVREDQQKPEVRVPIDARAIVEAMDRPDMRFVQVKTTDQQTVLLAHGVREQLIKQRTQTVNALRSHLAEFGVIYPKGIQHVNRICELVRERQEPEVPRFAYRLLDLLVDQIESLDKSIIAAEQDINEFFKRSEACQRLAEIPGIGVLTATALVATIGDARQFQGGRHLAAYLGLVPKQHSSGEKTVLRGISKRGNKYLRKLLIHGARSLCQKRKLESGKMPLKLKRLLGERQKPTNVAAVAMANTNARIVWVLLYYGGRYVPNHVSVRGVHHAMAL